MTFFDTQPAALGSADGLDPYAAFRVDSRSEIASILRGLADAGTPIQLNAPEGSMGSALWAVDANAGRLSLHAEPNHPQLAALLEADECTAVAYIEAVKLQFDLEGLVLVRSLQASVVQATLPQAVYRFQRRQGYRVRTQERNAPQAKLRHPSVPDMRITLRVLDMSIGGCALLLPDDMPAINPGVSLKGVRIALDAETQIEVTLQIHHVSSVQPPSRGVRLGCELRDLDGPAQRLLQRYIDQTQKRRRLLSLS